MIAKANPSVDLQEVPSLHRQDLREFNGFINGPLDAIWVRKQLSEMQQNLGPGWMSPTKATQIFRISLGVFCVVYCCYVLFCRSNLLRIKKLYSIMR